MVVRRATPEDRAGVIICARRFAEFETSDQHVGNCFDLALESDGMFVAVHDPETVVGFVCAAVLPHPFGGFPYLDVIAIFVQPSHRETSAGFRLLRELLRFANGLPLDMVKMSAPLGSQLGTLLQRAGFSAVETVYLKGSRWQAHRR